MYTYTCNLLVALSNIFSQWKFFHIVHLSFSFEARNVEIFGVVATNTSGKCGIDHF